MKFGTRYLWLLIRPLVVSAIMAWEPSQKDVEDICRRWHIRSETVDDVVASVKEAIIKQIEKL